jgi:hypothetical protein
MMRTRPSHLEEKKESVIRAHEALALQAGTEWHRVSSGVGCPYLSYPQDTDTFEKPPDN